ncbi:hypothetical protein GOBAR_DD35532 [Gossypium barbadense]|nr:hypothetical protein GOBAR_DD35532 [Gossypium barbadense]
MKEDKIKRISELWPEIKRVQFSYLVRRFIKGFPQPLERKQLRVEKLSRSEFTCSGKEISSRKRKGERTRLKQEKGEMEERNRGRADIKVTIQSSRVIQNVLKK